MNNMQVKVLYKENKDYITVNGSYLILYRNLHSTMDRPSIIYGNGDRIWHQNGLKHRDNDKPAVIYGNGETYWYKDGKMHRTNGKPAAVYPDGDVNYYINGNYYNKETYFNIPIVKKHLANQLLKGILI
jgi:hypothetical protein